MKIILTQMVPNLGSLGDEVKVKDGYARNFLLPKGMAIPAGGKNAKALQHRRVFLEKKRALAIDDARGDAEKVTSLELVLKARAGTGGRLFGSVTNRDLQAAIAEQGFELDRKSILLHTPVKSLGTFGATVKLHTDVKVDINFRVEPSEIVTGESSPDDAVGEEGAGGEESSTEATGEASAEAAADADPGAGGGAGEAGTGAPPEPGEGGTPADEGSASAPETVPAAGDREAEAAPAGEGASGEDGAEGVPSTSDS